MFWAAHGGPHGGPHGGEQDSALYIRAQARTERGTWGAVSEVRVRATAAWSPLGDAPVPFGANGLISAITPGLGLNLVTWRTESLSLRPVPGERIAHAASVAVTDSGHIVIAYVGIQSQLDTIANAVYVVRSRDSGATWFPDQALPAWANDGAFEPVLIAIGGERLALFWFRDARNGLDPRLLHAAESEDGGQSWRLALPHQSSHPLHRLDVAKGPCGQAFAVFEAIGRAGRRVSVSIATLIDGELRVTALGPDSLGLDSPALTATESSLDVLARAGAQPDKPLVVIRFGFSGVR